LVLNFGLILNYTVVFFSAEEQLKKVMGIDFPLVLDKRIKAITKKKWEGHKIR